MIALGTEVAQLGAEHADGTIWVDIEGDLWMPGPFGWYSVKRLPFCIQTSLASPSVAYGPYRAVLGPHRPPADHDQD